MICDGKAYTDDNDPKELAGEEYLKSNIYQRIRDHHAEESLAMFKEMRADGQLSSLTGLIYRFVSLI